MFLGIKLNISDQVSKRLQAILSDNQFEAEERLTKFHKEVTMTLAKKIFDHIKTTGFMGYRSDSNTRAYIAAIERLVISLDDAGVDIKMENLSETQQTRFFNEIIRQMKRILIPERSYCSKAYLGSFFKPEFTPFQLDEKAMIIARAVKTALDQQQNPIDTIRRTALIDGDIQYTPQEQRIEGLEQELTTLRQKVTALEHKQLASVSPVAQFPAAPHHSAHGANDTTEMQPLHFESAKR